MIEHVPNKTKTDVNQDGRDRQGRVLALGQVPKLGQVPIINFCDHFMNITSIIMSVCSLRMQMLFDLLYLVVKVAPGLLCLQRDLIRLCSAFLYDL